MSSFWRRFIVPAVVVVSAGCNAAGGDDNSDVCQTSDDCPAGQTCLVEEGVCQEESEPPCRTHADCEPGYFCDDASGECQPFSDGDPDESPGDADLDETEVPADGDEEPEAADSDDEDLTAEGDEETETEETAATECLTVEPREHDFGNVEIGAEPPCVTFTFTHVDAEGCGETLTFSQMTASGDTDQFYVESGDILPATPVRLASGGAHDLVVCFRPDTLADFIDPLRVIYRVATDSPVEIERLLELHLSGTSTNSQLSVFPWPIDFGVVETHGLACETANDCPFGQNCYNGACAAEIVLSVYNWTEEPLGIIELSLIETSAGACEAFSIDDWMPLVNVRCPPDECHDSLVCAPVEEWDVNLCQIQPGHATPGLVTLRFAPTIPGFYTDCRLRLHSTSPGLSYLTCDILGRGRSPNACPTVRLSRTQGGPPITTPVTDLITGQHACFYASAGDADGSIASYDWKLTVLPPGSLASLDQPEPTVGCLTFDVCGAYEIQLKVQDDDQCWSDPAIVSVDIPCGRSNAERERR
ncbi:MAG: hypothetical protein C4523_07340 [Myxococcales bacterium]|nr:MAG: hypothetical protein C4523_07340 [Myxococcales bacterium]